MVAVTKDLVIEQGITFNKIFVYADYETKVPIDLTDYKAYFKARKRYGSEEVTINLSSEGADPAITLGGSLGTIEILLDKETTAAYDFNSLYYNLEIENISGTNTRLLEGSIELSKRTTE